MKKISLIALFILFSVIGKSFGQKLEENKTDDFTKKIVKSTSWETLYTTMTANAYFRISVNGDNEFFDLKYQEGKIFSIDKDEELMFKLDNGEIVKVLNLEYKITCEGCGSKGFIGRGAEGIQVSYPLDKETIEKLKGHKVVKVRINITTGFYENEVKDKNAAKITASLNLL